MSPTDTPDVVDLNILVFELRWPFAEGWYWRAPKFRLVRGPFASQEEAQADVNSMARDLCEVILGGIESAPNADVDTTIR